MEGRRAITFLFFVLFVGIFFNFWWTWIPFQKIEVVEVEKHEESEGKETDIKISGKAKAIVTASSENHFVTLRWLLWSINRYEPKVPLIVYDLGFSDKQVERLKEIPNIDFRRFPFESYPDYFNINVARGEYAWKPVIIELVSREYKSIIWMDAGDEVTGPLDNTWNFIEQRGFYSGVSQGTISTWTHPDMLKAFKLDPNVYGNKRNCNAAFLGFGNKVRESILIPWRDCALKRECIAPIGSNRGNHRQDQAALTLIVYMNDFECGNQLVHNYQIHREYHQLGNLDDIYQIVVPTTMEFVSKYNRETLSNAPEFLRTLIGFEIGEEFTTPDVLGYLITSIGKRSGVKYLEIGVSIGNLYQMLELLGPTSSVTALDIEDINPSFANTLTNKKKIEEWESEPNLTRKKGDFNQFVSSSGATLNYFAMDELSSIGWNKITESNIGPFQVIYFGSGQIVEALNFGWSKLLEHNLIDFSDRWAIVWDDLKNDEMKRVVNDILKSSTPLHPNATLSFYKVCGRGKNEGVHTIGVFTNIDKMGLDWKLDSL